MPHWDQAETEAADLSVNQPTALRDASEETIAKEPPDPPNNVIDQSRNAIEITKALIHCSEKLNLLTLECIAIEPNPHLTEIAAIIEALMTRLKKLLQGIRGKQRRIAVARTNKQVGQAQLPLPVSLSQLPPTTAMPSRQNMLMVVRLGLSNRAITKAELRQ